MHARARRGLAVVVLAVGALGIAACGSGGGSVDGLTIAVIDDPGNLDPQRSVNDQNLVMSLFAYDTPVTLLNSGELAPQVVASWKASPKAYVLTVRKGVTCSDGSAMDAKTVADNINYVANPKNGSPMAGVAVPAGVKATADQAKGSVTVSLPSPQPFFMQNLAELRLVCSQGMSDRKSLAKATVGSGPYVLSKASPGVSYTYKLRKNYAWGPNGATTKSMPTQVTFKVTKSQTTTANLLLNGQLNIAYVAGADAKRLKSADLFSAGKQQVHNAVAFNTGGGAVADVAVRRALIGALDMPQLAKIDTGGMGTVADGLLAPPKICAGNTTTGHIPPYDPGAAARELDQSGWTVGADGIRTKGGQNLSVSLIFSNGEPTNSATAEYIAAQWRKLGVAVKLNEQSFQQTSAVVFGHGAWDATLIDLVVSNQATLVPFFSGPGPTKGNNFGRVHNAQYDSHVAKASKKPGTAGCPDWNAAESALFADADIAPISAAPAAYWGKNAKFRLPMGVLIPTSLRATAG